MQLPVPDVEENGRSWAAGEGRQERKQPPFHTADRRVFNAVIESRATGLWRLAMIHFCLAHTAYHCSRWLPKHHRLRLQAGIFILGLSALLLQVYILLRPRSSRYCGQPLLYNLVGSIVFTFFTVGLALLLVVVEPLTGELKIMLSIFGIGSFVEGVCTAILTSLATQCAKTTPELYYTSVVLSVSSMLSTATSPPATDHLLNCLPLTPSLEKSTDLCSSHSGKTFRTGNIHGKCL